MRARAASGHRWPLAAAAALGLFVAACDLGPTEPTPGGPPTPTPPPPNAAPTIQSITLGAERVEVGQSVTVVADVQDAETPLTALTYEWTASAGTVSGTGRSVTWSLASGAASTPADVMLTLTVLEPYQVLQGSQIVTQQHRVTATSGALRVHDSVAEIGAMVLRFLVDLFGDSSVGPDDAVVDFNRNLCPAGWQAEYNDIVDNRDTVTILSAEATIQSVAVTGAFASADVVAPCTFRDFVKPSGPQRTAAGTCTLTTVYEQNRWWLCTSNWDGTVVNSVSGTPLGHDPRVSGYR